MEKNAKFILVVAIIGLVAVSIGGYAYLKSREYLRGPQITIQTPADGSTQTTAPLTISGQAINVAYITLNGAPIFVDSNGAFNENILLLPGYNVVTLDAADRFGKKIRKTLQLVYKAATSSTEVASSTPNTPVI